MSTHHSLRITQPSVGAQISRVRKQFNSLSSKLEASRVKLRAWEELVPVVQGRVRDELIPLEDQFAVHRRALTCLLDKMSNDKALGKRERTKLSSWIVDTALDLLDLDDDLQIKEIYNRHSGRDLDEDDQQEAVELRRMIEAMYGIELDADLDVRSHEAVMAALHAARTRLPDQEGGAAEAEAEAEPELARKQRKPTARERALQQREAAETAQLKQTVRDIFRKLASALHPDREPDPGERARKTDLMQRVNVAYAADDLLGLLSLQLEIEQIDQAGLDSLGEQQIKRFNKILGCQIHEIEGEIISIEYMMEMSLPMMTSRRCTPETVLKAINTEVARMKKQNKSIVAELEALGDVVQLKAWLKKYRPRPAPDDDLPMFW